MPPKSGDPAPDTQLGAVCSSTGAAARRVHGHPAPLEPVPGQGRDRDTQTVGQPQREAQRSGSPCAQTMGDSPLEPWRVLASPHQRCRACSLRLTTSHGLPGAEPRDPAVTPSPFLSPSHNPALSTDPDTAAQRADLTLGAAATLVKLAACAHQLHSHLGSVWLLPVPALAQASPPGGFPWRGWLWGRDGAAGCRTEQEHRLGLPAPEWHLVARALPEQPPQDAGTHIPSGKLCSQPLSWHEHEHRRCQLSPAEPS